MKKKIIPSIVVVLFTFQVFGQVGIGTETPTEALDIDGTLRIRNMPIDGATNAIYTTGENTASDTPSETFNATQMLVLDANGVLGATPGLPSMSNTRTWTSDGDNFPTATNADAENAMRFSFGSLSVAFFRTAISTTNFQFWIKSSSADSYIVDIRNMTTVAANYIRANATIPQNIWQRIGGTTTYTLGTSWHVNVWLASVDKIYRLTVMSIDGSPDTLTLNIQEL